MHLNPYIPLVYESRSLLHNLHAFVLAIKYSNNRLVHQVFKIKLVYYSKCAKYSCAAKWLRDQERRFCALVKEIISKAHTKAIQSTFFS